VGRYSMTDSPGAESGTTRDIGTGLAHLAAAFPHAVHPRPRPESVSRPYPGRAPGA
jgi:hypothetical protein